MLSQGRMQDFSGGPNGPNYIFLWILDILVHAVTRHVVARGVWGHARTRKFFKMVQFRAFWELFSTTFIIKKILSKNYKRYKQGFFHWPFYAAPPLNLLKYWCYIRGVCRISQGGGPTLKFLGIWLCTCREAASLC